MHVGVSFPNAHPLLHQAIINSEEVEEICQDPLMNFKE